MKRHTLAYLFFTVFIGLTMVSFVIGSLPRAAAATLHAPVGLTETFTPTPINTSAPVETNTPVLAATNTSVPVATNTPVPADTNTPVPGPTSTPVPVETSTSIPADTSVLTDTQIAVAVVGLPNTGGAAPQGEISRWLLVLTAAVIVSLGTLAFRFSRRAYRPTRR